jgi:hypothetical protein
MTHVPRPLADPPRATARPPSPRRNEDHEPHLSGGARYAIGYQSQADRPGAGSSQTCAPVGQHAEVRHW